MSLSNTLPCGKREQQQRCVCPMAGTARPHLGDVRYNTEDAAALRKDDKGALVGERVRVFDDEAGGSSRVGTVRGVKGSLGAPTKHVIEFDGSGGVRTAIALQKVPSGKGARFHVLVPAPSLSGGSGGGGVDGVAELTTDEWTLNTDSAVTHGGTSASHVPQHAACAVIEVGAGCVEQQEQQQQSEEAVPSAASAPSFAGALEVKNPSIFSDRWSTLHGEVVAADGDGRMELQLFALAGDELQRAPFYVERAMDVPERGDHKRCHRVDLYGSDGGASCHGGGGGAALACIPVRAPAPLLSVALPTAEAKVALLAALRAL